MVSNTRIYPSFPIPAVGAVIVHADQVLLIQRGQPPAQGQWTLPGGVIELGESPEEALIREVKEECSLTITVVRLIEVVNRVIRDAQDAIKYHYIILDYLAHCQQSDSGRETVIRPGTDVIDARWVALSDLSQYNLTEGVLGIIQAGV